MRGPKVPNPGRGNPIVGAAYALNSTLTLDLRHHDTDEHSFGKIYGSRAVISLKAAF